MMKKIPALILASLLVGLVDISSVRQAGAAVAAAGAVGQVTAPARQPAAPPAAAAADPSPSGVAASAVGVTNVTAVGLTPSASATAPNAFLIETKGALPADLGRKISAAGGTLVREQAEIGVAEATSDAPDFAARLAADADVDAVTRDTLVQWIPTPASMTSVHLSVPPVAGTARGSRTAAPAAVTNPANAYFLACQWGLAQVGAAAVWAQGALGAAAQQVAVLDTGIDASHIDLAGRVDVEHSANFLTPGSSPCGAADEATIDDHYFHGTFVASLIAGNGVGVAGIAPHAGLVAVKVLNCSGSASFGDLIAGIHYAASLPSVDVINLSLGALVSRQDSARLAGAVAKAIDYANSHGKLVVVAAGNNAISLDHDGDLIAVPAEAASAVAIAATGVSQALVGDSNRGLKVWASAPGGELPNAAAALAGCPVAQQYQSLTLGACPATVCGSNHQYVLGAGTAFAAPLAAGLAELADAARGGATPPATLKAALASHADAAKATDSTAVASTAAGSTGTAVATGAAAAPSSPPRIDAVSTVAAVTGAAHN